MFSVGYLNEALHYYAFHFSMKKKTTKKKKKKNNAKRFCQCCERQPIAFVICRSYNEVARILL